MPSDAGSGLGGVCGYLGWRVWSAAGAEEVGEEGSTLVGEEAGEDFDAVVELGVVDDAESDD